MSGFATSIISRAVADANKHASANRFRQFTSPKVYEVMRKRSINYKSLCKLASSASTERSFVFDGHTQTHHSMIVDQLPFVKNIFRNDDVFSRRSNQLDATMHYDAAKAHEAREESTRRAQEQQEILALDDIDEVSSSENEDEFVIDPISSFKSEKIVDYTKQKEGMHPITDSSVATAKLSDSIIVIDD